MSKTHAEFKKKDPSGKWIDLLRNASWPQILMKFTLWINIPIFASVNHQAWWGILASLAQG